MIQINKRNIAFCILLSFITFGIYNIYWYYLLVKNIREIKNDNSGCAGEILCYIFVPFYCLYWWFTRGKSVKDEFTKHGYSASGNETVYLILGIFGLQIVSMAIMQHDFNSLGSERNHTKDNSEIKAKKQNIETLRGELKQVASQTNELRDDIANFESAVKPYITAKKLLTQAENYQKLDEISSVYEEAKVRHEKALADAAEEAERKAAEEKEYEAKLKAEKAAKKANKK